MATERFGINRPPFTHGRIVCDSCKSVVAQCRCMESCKTVGTVKDCEKCRDATPVTEAEHE